jgi:phenylalanyl-tRNA synthetase beta chain
MKISRHWLQKYFEEELPSTEVLSDALTFHAFEIDGIEHIGNDEVLDVKVTPNRGHDCLSHRGIAREVSAILKIPLTNDPLKDAPNLSPKAATVLVSIENSQLCPRYIAGHIRGVKVAPSPRWLKERLETLGQRSINNVVDATNFVMFNLGQPLHAFDAGKLTQNKDGNYAIEVRSAKQGEKMLALDGKEYVLSESMLVIADASANLPIGIAGIKGGMPAGITGDTKEIIIESANFDGPSVRKTAQQLKLRTDASARFEQVLSPELAAYGMRSAVDLILKLAGGEVEGFNDVYPVSQKQSYAAVTVEKINSVLGVTLTGAEVADVFLRLGFSYKEEADVFEIHVPFERLDIEIAEDLVEEVGRIIGYDKVPAILLPSFSKPIEINNNFYWTEKIREYLVSQGFSEVYTSVFADTGERVVLNKVDGVRPYLRMNLKDGLDDALARNIHSKDLLGIKQVKLFEIGVVWKGGVETVEVEIAVENIGGKHKTYQHYRAELDDFIATISHTPTSYDNLSLSQTDHYQSFSKFPYIIRDVSVWLPQGNSTQDYKKSMESIFSNASDSQRKVSFWNIDEYEKGGKKSVSYRLIFQSFDRTLTDEEVSVAMEKVYTELTGQGFEIR